MRPGKWAVSAASVLAGLLGSTASAQDKPVDDSTGAAASSILPAAPDYSRVEHWLCRPGAMSHCVAELDATIVNADGRTEIERWQQPTAGQPVDCFYLYPTASLDAAPNSDLVPGTGWREEISIVRMQAARFAEVCRLYAPLYRSSTVAAMRGAVPPADRDAARADMIAAWRHYLNHDNDGRGVVLIGHSQGASGVREILKAEIEGKPAQRLLVGAYVIGGSIAVPPGQDTGGDLKSIRLCRAEGEAGCVVTYASFRADLPPGEDGQILGRRADGLRHACTNPASLAGGEGDLDGYLPTVWRDPAGNPTPQDPWARSSASVETDWVKVPGLLTATCAEGPNGAYLAVTTHGDPADARVDRIKGDVERDGIVQREWGLHMIDLEVAQGNLIELVRAQAGSWASNRNTP